MKEVNENGTYRCGTGEFTLDVTVGEGQTGAISVYRNGTKIEQGVDKLEGVPLRDCTEGPEVKVRATVNRVNAQSPRVSVACVFHGAAGDPEVVTGPDVEVGEPVHFKIVYTREQG